MSDEAAARLCKIHDCDKPASRRIVVLLNPDGSEQRAEHRRDRRYCDQHTDRLLGNLRHTFTGGAPALRVETADV